MFAWHDKKINHKFILFTDFSNLISLRQIVAGQEEVKDICGSNPSYIPVTRATSITGIRALLKNQNTLT